MNTLNFSALKAAVAVNLGTTAVQSVHRDCTLKLNFATNFEIMPLAVQQITSRSETRWPTLTLTHRKCRL